MIRIRSTRAASLRPVAVVAAALSLLSLPLSLALVSVPVLAQAFPSKPLRLIVGYPPGGGIDFTARVIQSPLQDALKQSLVIDYKPGAGGTIAAADLTRANADGYTLLVANTGPFAIAPYLQAKMPYDPVKQFTYIGQISQGSYIAVTRTDHPAKDLREFVAWAKANTGKANFASGGAGTSTHLNGELMNAATGLALTHVPYKGSAPAIAELLGGQTQIMIDAGTALLPMIRAGKLRALAVTGTRRDPQLPDVATVGELGLGAMASVGFQGLVGPAGIPKDRVALLSGALARALDQPDVRAKFSGVGSEVTPLGAEAFGAFVRAENAKWQKLIRERKLQLN